jgi:hypothetical protein
MDDFGLLVAKYNSTLPTLADGDGVELQVDVNGRLLVQADVTVLVDFLGLNGAADNANILVVGTEDGTATGTAHAIRLTSNGSVVVDIDDSTPIDVNVTNTVTVEATDLDIRDLTHVSDSVQIGDGTEIMLVNADGSINAVVTASDLDIRDLDYTQDSVTSHQGGDWSVEVAPAGTEAFLSGESLDFTGTADVVSIAVAEGDVVYLYGYEAMADRQCVITVEFDSTVLKKAISTSSLPNVVSHFAESGRIELTGQAGGSTLKLKAVKLGGKGGNASAFGSLHVRAQ